MNWNPLFLSLFGGCLIGVAVTLMLLFNGRVTGISGILSLSLSERSKEGRWRWFFLAGLILGGVLMYVLRPEQFANLSNRGPGVILIAGLLVGYGTVMGGGCT